ncbi:hypothetical protein C8R44DRAFT_988918 [Mycena epipterygia]|nr:hypothetical protein C8R44DRAFT_988918 [Mycena epipterygia]
MAVTAVLGAVATIAGTILNLGAGFPRRHEASHDQELQETRRNREDFMQNLRSGGVTPEMKNRFLKTKDEANKRLDEYYESIVSYKDASWLNPLDKTKKKKAVRRAKRATQRSNHSLRKLNESMRPSSEAGEVEDQATWLCTVQ